MTATTVTTTDRSVRAVQQLVSALPTSDGAGVKLRRSLGARPGVRLDPFLMLDEFYSDNPDDYLAGFPAHPHRGFETVTYMLDGRMQHRDHLGNTGDLGPGSVQWMTAARGIIHSEMPMQQSGRMRGFQLWLNLPARDKMKPASYQDIAPERIPLHQRADGASLKLIAGRLRFDGVELTGPVNGSPGSMATDPLYADLQLPAGATLELPLADERNAFVYVYEGVVQIGTQRVARHQGAVLGRGALLQLAAADDAPARALLLAARPLGEPVVQYGPFVMNTAAEIEQAIRDYQAGRLAA